MGTEHANLFFVEQPEQEAPRRQFGIDQLGRGGRRHQHHRAPPAILDIVGDDVRAALRRDALQHETAGAPGAVWARARRRQFDAGLDLLRLPEIVLGAFREVAADQLDDALIALGVLALIDREGDIAGADQFRHRRALPRRQVLFGEPRAVVLRIAAHRALGRDIGDDEAHRPIAFRLQREDAVIFERAGQHHGERDRLAENRRYRFGVIVLRQDAIDRRAEPYQPAAERERVNAKGLDEIVGSRFSFRRQQKTPAFQ